MTALHLTRDCSYSLKTALHYPADFSVLHFEMLCASQKTSLLRQTDCLLLRALSCSWAIRFRLRNWKDFTSIIGNMACLTIVFLKIHVVVVVAESKSCQIVFKYSEDICPNTWGLNVWGWPGSCPGPGAALSQDPAGTKMGFSTMLHCSPVQCIELNIEDSWVFFKTENFQC